MADLQTPENTSFVTIPESPRILLLVDDEQIILASLTKLFQSLYTVHTASSAEDALNLLRKGVRPQVILADQRMPGISGAKFLGLSREIVPETVRIILTGYTDVKDLADCINIGKAYSYLTKPWNNNDLKEAVRLAFEHYDLSEEKAALSAALADVKALNEEKTELMNIVSHDLKNPIGAIMGMSDLLMNDDSHYLANIRIFSGEIYKLSARMLALVGNLLDINAVESNKLKFFPVTLYPTSMLQIIADEFKWQTESKKITLLVQGSEHITVLADEIWFHRVMENLVSNAVKFSPHNKNIFISITQHGLTVRVSVRDEGPGINSDDRKKLFGKFSRLSAQPTGDEHSSGLGLCIVKKFVEVMNGKVWCESEPGQGATFIVELPAA